MVLDETKTLAEGSSGFSGAQRLLGRRNDLEGPPGSKRQKALKKGAKQKTKTHDAKATSYYVG